MQALRFAVFVRAAIAVRYPEQTFWPPDCRYRLLGSFTLALLMTRCALGATNTVGWFQWHGPDRVGTICGVSGWPQEWALNLFRDHHATAGELDYGFFASPLLYGEWVIAEGIQSR